MEHGKSWSAWRIGDAGSGRKEVKEKGDEKDRVRQVQWRWVYRLVFLISNLGHQGSYGSFDTRLGMRDTEVLQWLTDGGILRGSIGMTDHFRLV